MKKRLLFGLMAACVCMSTFGQQVLNTKTAAYVTTGGNICTNGTFANASYAGWTPVSATEGTTCEQLFTYNAETGAITAQSNLFSEGMYYKFTASAAEPYVVSFKIRQQNGTWPFSTNIRYTSTTDDGGTVTNTYGCQGTNGTGKNYISLFGNNGGVTSGTDFVNTGYAIQLTADWQTVNFATLYDGVSRDWYLYICNMAADVEIKDIEIYPAAEVADLRKTAEPLAFAKAIANAYAWPESDELTGLQENIQAVEELTSDSYAGDLTDALDGLQAAVDEFVAANVDDYLATCKKGSKWEEVSDKGQKIKTIGDWTHFYLNGEGVRDYNTDRMMHCNNNDAATRATMAYWLSTPDYGYGSALGSQGLIMTKTLKAGTYIFAMKGNSHTQYQSNTPFTGANGYESNDGWHQAKMTLSIEKADGTEIGSQTSDYLPALWDDYAQTLLQVRIPEDGEYNFVVLCTQPTDNEYYGTNRAYGGSYYLSAPQILCKLDGFNAKELAYIDAVKAQINAGRENYDQAIAYLADETYLWGRDALKACTDTMLVKLQSYEAMDEAAIVATFDVDTYEAGATNENAQLEHEVYVEVARDLIAANRTFVAVNDTLTSLTTAINDAKDLLNARVYDACTGKEAFQSVISEAEQLNAAMRAAAYSVENAAAIVDMNGRLAAAGDEYKTTLPATATTTLADIDFETPATDVEGTYTIAGAVNSMVMPNFNTDEQEQSSSVPVSFFQGFWSGGEKLLPGVLRVGNGEAIVNIADAQQVSGTNILRLSFDFYFGRLTKTNGSPGGAYVGFYLNDADNNKIAQLYFSPYWAAVAAEENNTFGLNISSSYLLSVGSSSQQNNVIGAESNKTSFEVILDYGEKSMYASTTNAKGVSQTTQKIYFPGTPMASFSVVSNYENAARRCWFDNLKIEQITAGETTPFEPQGIVEVNANAKVNAPAKYFKDGRIVINGKYAVNGVRVK